MLTAQNGKKAEHASSYGAEKPFVVLRDTPEEGQGSLFDGTLQNLIKEFGLVHHKFTSPTTEFDQRLYGSTDGVLEISKSGTIMHVNDAVRNILAYEPGELVRKNLFPIILPEYHGAFKIRIKKGMESIIYQRLISESKILFRAYSKLKRVFSLEAYFFPLYRSGEMVFLLIMRRITQDDALVRELKESAHNYDALSETISEVILRLDEHFTVIFVNSAIKRVFGYSREEILGKHFKTLFPGTVFDRYKDEFSKYFFIDLDHRHKSGLRRSIETLGKSKNRGITPIEISFGNSRNYEGRSVTCIIRDISQRKNTERKLRHLAFHDKLTGLGNRDLFNSDMGMIFKSNEQKEKNAALFFLDLDGFKQVNDTFGHDFGDKLLIHTAKRIRGSLRETDAIYRFGGDEFVILINNITKTSEAALIAQNVLNEIQRPYYLESMGTTTVVTIGVSIGIAMIPENGNSISEIVKNADLAMYSAKTSGKNRFVFYHTHLNSAAQERWDIEQGLKNAITHEELQMYYQPIVTPDGTVKGFEALIRWFHPVRGLISPAKFIPIAEESGIIKTLGVWIMENSCRDLHTINESGYGNLYVSFNLSAVQFNQTDLAERIANVIQRTEARPENLRLEITETSIVKMPERVVNVITSLKRQYPKIKFVLDDFGTGYSSLSYLSRMPIDSLKIDISFVRKLFEPMNLKVVTAIMNLANSLQLNIVAEGVEGTKERDFFKEKGCNALQGFLFAKPMPFSDIMDRLRSGALKS